MKIPRCYYEKDFDEFELYLRSKPHNIVHYAKGEMMFMQPPPSNVYYYIVDGLCTTYSITEQGDRKIIYYSAKGYFSTLALDMELDSIYVHGFVEANSPVTILQFSRDTMLEILKENHAFVLRMFSFTNDVLALLTYYNMTSSYLSSEMKLCDCLYMMYIHLPHESPGSACHIPIHQEQIANQIGVTRTQVTRLLKNLKEDGIIETHRGSIDITDPKQLLARCSKVMDCG